MTLLLLDTDQEKDAGLKDQLLVFHRLCEEGKEGDWKPARNMGYPMGINRLQDGRGKVLHK